jgi:hypothetical protein
MELDQSMRSDSAKTRPCSTLSITSSRMESADVMVRNRCETACMSGSDGNSLLDEVGETDESLGGMLLTIFEPDAAVSWLRGPNSYLGGRPIDFLRAGRLDDVWDAVRAAEQTAWGG